MNKEDIEVISIGINDTFRYAGKVFHGLEDLKKSAFEDYNKKRLTGVNMAFILLA